MQDPYTQWLTPEVIETMSGEHIAVHPTKGVVFHHPDEDTFWDFVDRYPPDDLLITHASVYTGASIFKPRPTTLRLLSHG